jgi:ABC transport system ATP-binding/permease protein
MVWSANVAILINSQSTLAQILAGKLSPDSGTLSIQKALRTRFLEQVPTFQNGSTLWSSLFQSGHDPNDWETIGTIREQISRLSLDHFPEDTPVAQLSGGWQKRLALARELVKNPDLLILDEPTNHLDVETILWLEDFLARAPFATLTITHDRFFLQKVSNRIIELDPRHKGGLLSVRGNYADYVHVREQLLNAQERREIILKNTLRRETEWLRQGAKARTTKQQARIERAENLKQDVEELSARNQHRVARIDFQAAEKNPKRLLEAKNISKSYGENNLFKNLNIVLTPGTRLGLLGANGCGKSTLIRTLLGEELPSSGKITQSEHFSVSYFDQRRDTLNPTLSLSKTLCPLGDSVDFRGTRVHIRSYLDRFLFTPSQMDMPVGRLSGGEQSRILIARLMLTRANLLVLDEPTNDLDMATLGLLEECLVEFPGAIILVTHDRYFMSQVATQIMAFAPNGELTAFATVSQWETWSKTQSVNRLVSKVALSTPK